MKNRNLFLGLFTVLILLTSCDADPCDDGYTQVQENGSSFCLPDYVVGIEKLPEFGNTFYHNDYGIIKFENEKWSDQNDEIINNLIQTTSTR